MYRAHSELRGVARSDGVVIGRGVGRDGGEEGGWCGAVLIFLGDLSK